MDIHPIATPESLELVIGTDVQAWDAQLDDIAGLAVTNSNFIVGDGFNWVAESGATARSSIGLGEEHSPTFTELTLTVGGSTYFSLSSGIIRMAAGGDLYIGQADIRRGFIALFGDGATSNDGGQINLHCAADYDSTINLYSIKVNQDDLWIGPSTDLNALRLTGSNFFVTGGNLDVTGNIVVSGTVDGVDVAALKTDVDGFPDELKNVTATGAEINIIDGATLTTTELNYVDGVTSAIQTQIDGKIANIVEDISPQLGGDLDGQSYDIKTTGTIATSTYAVTSGSKFSYKTATITPIYIGISEIISDASNLLPAGTDSGLNIEAYFDPDDAVGGFQMAESLFNVATGTLAGTMQNQVGLFGGTNTVIDNDGSYSIDALYGLLFSCSNAANFVGKIGVGNYKLNTYGSHNTGKLGFDGYTISNKALCKNYGGYFEAKTDGTFNSTITTSENYGVYAKTTDGFDDGSGDLTSYGVYIDACASNADLGSGGVLTSYSLYVANDVPSYIAGRVDFNNDIVLPKTSGKGIKVDTTTPTFGWRDLLGEPTTKNTGATKPSYEAYNGAIDGFRYSDGDEEQHEYHIPHDYVLGTDIYLHIHWSQISASNTGGTIDFKYSAIYSKGHNQAAFTSTPITDTITSADAGSTRYQHFITEQIISGASATAALFDRDDIEPDGVILLTLEMDSNDLTDSVAVTNPFIHFVDIHYQSTNIATKDKAPDFYA